MAPQTAQTAQPLGPVWALGRGGMVGPVGDTAEFAHRNGLRQLRIMLPRMPPTVPAAAPVPAASGLMSWAM